MEWLGRVGRIRELFRSKWEVVFEWIIPKIFSMPDIVGAVHYSPELNFLGDIWYLGIHRNVKEWIGLEIWRSHTAPQISATFSVCVNSEDCNDNFTHCNQRYPEKSLSCSLDKFLLESALLRCRAQLAPLDVLTITCMLRRDEPCERAGTSIELVSREIQTDEVAEAIDEDFTCSTTEVSKLHEGFLVKLFQEVCLEGHLKPEDTGEGYLKTVSEGVQWKFRLPPQQTQWDIWSPNFTCGEIICRFNLYPGGLHSDCVYLNFCITVPGGATFPLQLGWQSGVQMRDGAGIRWLMAGKEEVKEKCNRHAQQIRIKRADLEGWLSSDACLTFVHRVNVGDPCSDSEVSTQTEGQGFSESQASCEAQTEHEAVEEKRRSQEVEELEERRLHLRMWLQNPEEGDRIRQLRREKLEANWEKILLKFSREEKEPLFYAA